MHILEETKREQQKKKNLKERHEKQFITINPGGQDFFSSFIININVEYGITYMEVTPMHFAHYSQNVYIPYKYICDGRNLVIFISHIARRKISVIFLYATVTTSINPVGENHLC